MVAAYPSRGLDIATVRAGQELLLDRRAKGCGVLLISEDLDELFELCDRIVVLHDGEVAGDRAPVRDDPPRGGQPDAGERGMTSGDVHAD